MLKTLKRIVQDVTTAGHLTDALTTLVHRVREALSIDAVSVYLIDNKHAEYVLIATEGLDKHAESAVRIPMNQGLVGLVGRREEPINIDNAPRHAAFLHEPRLAETHLLAFLGVPIIQHRKLYGVLTAQQTELIH